MGRNGTFISDIKDANMNAQFELLFKVLDFEEESGDATVCDAKGRIVAVSQSFASSSAADGKNWIGKTVFDLENEKIYSPSVAAKVLKEKKRITLIHKNQFGKDVITTSVPIFKNGTNNIEYVVSFAAINIQQEYGLNQQIEELKDTLNKYRKKIDELESEKLNKHDLLVFGEKMQKVKETCEHIAKVDANVLITGESGVGKNIVARYIHDQSNRSKGSLVEINCGSIPDNLLESELFGYEDGAFTGASKTGKKGLIEMAKDGTLFLDEIGELPINMQSKLLRVIQTKQILKVGATKPIEVDFRLITATNRELSEEINKKRFREDLFYRLNVIPINIVPLRERREDIEYMAQYFLEIYNRKYGKKKIFSRETIYSFNHYNWPGNVRELENLVERLVVTEIGNEIAFEIIPKAKQEYDTEEEDLGGVTLKQAIDNYEGQIFRSLYKKYKSSIEIGKILGIAQTTASNKIRKYIK